MSKKEDNIEISVIITAHHEGLVIYKTLLSISQALQKIREKNIPFEIIVHIDNGDKETKRCIVDHQKEFGYRIFENHFGEPASSRNYAIERAKGQYVLCLDGDDLISSNWIIDGYQMLSTAKTDIILHSEADITFSYEKIMPRIWLMKDSFDKDKDDLILFGRNRWCSGTFLRKEIATKYPYIPANKGYGYEDWHFNCETRANGVKHLVIPRAIIFHRIKKDSTFQQHINDNVVNAFTEEFSTQRMKELAERVGNEPIKMPADNNRVTRYLSYGYKIIKHIPVVKKTAETLAKKAHRYQYEKKTKAIPKWLIEQWKEQNKIDNGLYPDYEILSRIQFYSSEEDYLGRIYCQLIKNMKKDPDYIFLPPQLNIGGTEKVIVNYLNAFAKIHPKWHIVVLSSLPNNHPYKIPKNVDFIDYNTIMEKLNWWDRDFILSRLIVQTKVKRLHIINNDEFFRWANSHKELLTNNHYIVNVSHFMHEYSEEKDRIISFADPSIRELYPCINKIFTDNSSVIKESLKNNAFDEKKFSIHYQPIDIGLFQKNERKEKNDKSGKINILWASRISPQKRPDILLKIARKINSNNYSIDVYGRFQKPYTKKIFKNIKTINYKGSYNGIENLDTNKYDLFLYTSDTDGLPNILLEIGALGIPIIASNDGGVSDLITDKETGRLINIEDIDGYIQAIKDYKKNQDNYKNYSKKLKRLVSSRHSWDNYIKTIKKDI